MDSDQECLLRGVRIQSRDDEQKEEQKLLPSLMLAKKHKLTLQTDFKRVYSYKHVIHTKHFAVYKAPNNLKNSRFSLIVANKVSKKAVDRNRIRRRMRQVILRQLENIPTTLDIIISAKPAILPLDFKDTEQALIRALNKAKLL